jgi:hypothetical protein
VLLKNGIQRQFNCSPFTLTRWKPKANTENVQRLCLLSMVHNVKMRLTQKENFLEELTLPSSPSSKSLYTQFSLKPRRTWSSPKILKSIIQGHPFSSLYCEHVLPKFKEIFRKEGGVCFHVAVQMMGQANRERSHCQQDLHCPSRNRKAARFMWLTKVQG